MVIFVRIEFARISRGQILEFKNLANCVHYNTLLSSKMIIRVFKTSREVPKITNSRKIKYAKIIRSTVCEI